MDADSSNWQSLDSQGPLHSATARTASAVRLAAREFDLANTVAVLLYSSTAQLSLRGTYIWNRISLAVFFQEKTLTKAGWAQCRTPFESTAFQLTDVCNFICRRIILNQESSLQRNPYNSRKGVLMRRHRVSLLFVNLPQGQLLLWRKLCLSTLASANHHTSSHIMTHHDTSPHIVI